MALHGSEQVQTQERARDTRGLPGSTKNLRYLQNNTDLVGDEQLLLGLIALDTYQRNVKNQPFKAKTFEEDFAAAVEQIQARTQLDQDERLDANSFNKLSDEFGQKAAQLALDQLTIDNPALDRVNQGASLTSVRETAAAIQGGLKPEEARTRVLAGIEAAKASAGANARARLAQRKASQKARASLFKKSSSDVTNRGGNRQAIATSTSASGLLDRSTLSRRRLLESTFLG